MARTTILLTTLVFCLGAARVAQAQPDDEPKKTGYLGVYPANDAKGVKLTNVMRGGPAAKGGLRKGDIITHINGKEMKNTGALRSTLGKLHEGDAITVKFLRDGKEMETKFPVGGREAPEGIGESGDPLEGTATKDFDTEDFARLPLPRDPERIDARDLSPVAAKAGDAVNWVEDFDKALETARRLKRPILFYAPKWPATPTYRPKDYDHYMRATAFTHPSTVALLNSRFVCFRTAMLDPRDRKLGRFLTEEARKHGLDRFHIFEPALLFLKPDGSKIHLFDRIATLHEDLFNHVLRSILKDHPELAGESGSKKPEALLARGDWEEITKGDPYFQGEALLRLRKFREAKAKLEEALENAKDRARVELSLMRAHIRLDELKEAQRLGITVLERDAKGPHAAEALAYLAEVSWLRKDDATALGLWKRLFRDFPESPFGAEAAVALIGKHPLQHNMEHLGALPERWFERQIPHTHEKVAEADAKELAARSVRNLLRWQRSDGRWTDSAYQFMGPEHRPNTNTAITALSALALHEWRSVDPEAVDAALAKAEASLKDHGNLSRTSVEKIYAYAYTILYWSRVAKDSDGDRREEALKEAGRLIVKLEKMQAPSGGWGHEYVNPFATGVVVDALGAAKSVGLETADRAGRKGTEALLKGRSDEGGWPYSGYNNQSSLVSSVGRSPVCELACLRFGKSDEDNLHKAVKNFVDNLSLMEGARQYDYHAGPYAIGGFFFYHDFYPATDALLALPEGDDREAMRKKLLAALLGYPEANGSFQDSPNIGRSYGTAMGLLSLKNLMKD